MFINLNLWMTLTCYMTRSTYVTHAFEWEKLFKCHLKGKTFRKWANGLKIYDSVTSSPRATIAHLRVNGQSVYFFPYMGMTVILVKFQAYGCNGFHRIMNIGQNIPWTKHPRCFLARVDKISHLYLPGWT